MTTAGANDAGSGETNTQTQGSQEEGPTSVSQSAEDIFAAEAARLTQEGDQGIPESRTERIDGEPEGFSDLGQPTQEKPQVPSENQEITQEADDQSTSELEGDDSKKERNSWKDWKAKYDKEAQEKLDLLKRIEALEKSEPQSKPTEAPEAKAPEPEEPFEPTQEVKDLLDYTNGLKEYVQHEAKTLAKEIAREIIDNEMSTRDAQATQAKEQETVQATENTFWENVGDWFGSEYPEFSLMDIRQAPEFNDWLAANNNWVQSQLATATDRADISGAKKVYGRYMSTTHPNSGKKVEQPQDTGNANKLAAARTPSMPTSPAATSQTSEQGSAWDDAVRSIKGKSRSNIRTTI